MATAGFPVQNTPQSGAAGCWQGEYGMSGSVPSAPLFDLSGFPPAGALAVPMSLGAATLMRGDSDLSLIDSDGHTFTLYGYFSYELMPLQGRDGIILSSQEILSRTAQLSAATFRSTRLFEPVALETLLNVAFGEQATLKWQGPLLAADDTLTLQKTALSGVVTCNGIVLRRGDTITLADLQQGRVRYYHDESLQDEDALEFSCAGDQPLMLRVRLNIMQTAA
jgi:hypothetical protein